MDFWGLVVCLLLALISFELCNVWALLNMLLELHKKFPGLDDLPEGGDGRKFAFGALTLLALSRSAWADLPEPARANHGGRVTRHVAAASPEPVAPPRSSPSWPGVGRSVGGPTSPDGKVQVTCDLPVEMRHRNRGGTDRAGLCVFASLDHAALYQNDRKVIGLFQKMFREPGGGWPRKVDAMMAKYCPGARYAQYEGRDLGVLERALNTGRMVCVTYGPDHMVNLIHLDQGWAACLDNNFIGEQEIRWFKRAEFQRVFAGNGNGWAIVLLHPRPPAPPRQVR